jgi:ribosomal protein S27E
LNIWEVEFSIKEKIELDEDMLSQLPDDVNPEDIHQHVSRTIHLGGDNFFDVQEEAIGLIEAVFFEDVPEEEIDYEILGIKQLENIWIANWPEQESPLVRAERMADEDIMLVKCPKCDNIIRIAEEGWDWVRCKKCDTEITKDQLLKLGKHWVVVKIGKDTPK